MSSALDGHATRRLWSLWEMLQGYYPIYEIALLLQSLRTTALLLQKSVTPIPDDEIKRFDRLLAMTEERCTEFGLTFTSDMAKRIGKKPVIVTYSALFPELDHLNDSLVYELQKEAVFRVPPEHKGYYEQGHLFGKKVSKAFPSCERDIRKAGSCYAFGQEDACVHHLMLVLERGLNALAAKVGIPYQRANWQNIIDQIASKLKSIPKSKDRDFYLEVNAQFGFLKDSYRNHSEHARDDQYDMPKALHILNHVREFMQALEKGGLAE
jgi:hypothetical protein